MTDSAATDRMVGRSGAAAIGANVRRQPLSRDLLALAVHHRKGKQPSLLGAARDASRCTQLHHDKRHAALADAVAEVSRSRRDVLPAGSQS